MGRPKLRTAHIRDEVLRQAVQLLERQGPAGLSARHVAAAAGTSTAALYEFFGDKAGLVRAIYFEGFGELRRALERVDDSGNPRDVLVELLRAGHRFAIARPILTEVMTSRPIAEFTPSEEDRRAATEPVVHLIVVAVERWLRSERSTASADETTALILATHSGLLGTEIAAIAGGALPRSEELYERGVEIILAGVLAPEVLAS